MISIIGGSAFLAAAGLYVWLRIGVTVGAIFCVGCALATVGGICAMTLWIAGRAHLVALEQPQPDWAMHVRVMLISAISVPLAIAALLWFDGTIEMFLGYRHVRSLNTGGDAATAIEWLERAAAKGDTIAMWQLAQLYHSGQGVAKDFAAAMKWYEQAAEAGDADAMYAIGRMYANGEGVAKNEMRYFAWMQRAANAGSAAAHRELQQRLESSRDAP